MTPTPIGMRVAAVVVMAGLAGGAVTLLLNIPHMALPPMGQAALIAMALLLLSFLYPWWRLLNAWYALGARQDWMTTLAKRPESNTAEYQLWYWFRLVKAIMLVFLCSFVAFAALAATGALGGEWK